MDRNKSDLEGPEPGTSRRTEFSAEDDRMRGRSADKAELSPKNPPLLANNGNNPAIHFVLQEDGTQPRLLTETTVSLSGFASAEVNFFRSRKSRARPGTQILSRRAHNGSRHYRQDKDRETTATGELITALRESANNDVFLHGLRRLRKLSVPGQIHHISKVNISDCAHSPTHNSFAACKNDISVHRPQFSPTNKYTPESGLSVVRATGIYCTRRVRIPSKGEEINFFVAMDDKCPRSDIWRICIGMEKVEREILDWARDIAAIPRYEG